jgi:hypothetical protein
MGDCGGPQRGTLESGVTVRIIRYFRELLLTLKRIESHLAKLAECIQEGNAYDSGHKSISVRDYNH